MHRFLLYPFFESSCAMKAFTASGSERLVCLLRNIRAFLVNFIVESALLSFFIWIRTFRIRAVYGCRGLVCWT